MTDRQREQDAMRHNWCQMKGCKCTFAQYMVGDGCEVCNPELAAELARYARPPCQQCGAMTEDEATSRCLGRAAGDGCHGTDLWP